MTLPDVPVNLGKAHMKLPPALVAAIFVALAAVSSCSSGDGDAVSEDSDATSTSVAARYDASVIETALVELQRGTVGDFELGAAACPDDVELTEGVTFECTLEVGDAVAPYTVDLTRVATDEPKVHVKPAKAIIATESAVDFVRGNLDEAYADAQVSCGSSAVVVLDPGSLIPCTISVGSDTQEVNLVVTDLEGTIKLQQ